jgi:hypothetical protein
MIWTVFAEAITEEQYHDKLNGISFPDELEVKDEHEGYSSHVTEVTKAKAVRPPKKGRKA